MPKLGDVPSAGRVLVRDAAPKRGGGDWRERYGFVPEGLGAENGREAVCRTLGGVWLKLLGSMSEAIQEAGAEPLVDIREQWVAGAIILTIDKVLPPEVQPTPEVVAAGATTVLTAQRLIKAQAIREARARKEMDAARGRSGSFTAPAPVKPPPDAPTEDVTAARSTTPPPAPAPPPTHEPMSSPAVTEPTSAPPPRPLPMRPAPVPFNPLGPV